MRKNALLFIISMLWISLFSFSSASSIPFSGSYMLRAEGSEAIYWNPANINSRYKSFIFPGMNQSIGLGNNSFDLDTYNYLSGRYLNADDKKMILDKVNGGVSAFTEAHLILFGMTINNIAYATSSHAVGNIRVSDKYIKIALLGNEESDYYFSKNKNQLNALSYQDISIGYGDFEISHLITKTEFPDIKVGASVSGLIGIGVAQTESYRGLLHTAIDGMDFKQDLYIKTGLGGYGVKALVSLYTEPISNLKFGLSFDNLLWQMKWIGTNERHHFVIKTDSIYVSDFDDDDIINEHDTEKLNSFTTRIPVNMRLAALYQQKYYSLSCDWIQGFEDSIITGSIGTICLGAEFLPVSKLPIQIGLTPGNSNMLRSFSYGIGYRGRHIDFGIGLKSIRSILPGYYTRGITLSSKFNLHY